MSDAIAPGSRLRILCAAEVWFPDVPSGAGRYASDLARGLLARGHQPVVLTESASGLPAEETISDGIPVFRCPQEDKLHAPWQALDRLTQLAARLHQQHHFDMVAMHQPWFGWGVQRALRDLPAVYHFHSPWSEEYVIQHRMRDGWAWAPTRWPRWAIAAWQHRVERRVVRACRRQATLSDYMRDMLVSMHQVPREHVALLPGAVDLARFHPPADRAAVRRTLGIPEERIAFLTVRRWAPRMNLEALLTAMTTVCRQHRDAHLYIGGWGPLEQALRRQIAATGLTACVTMLGRLTDEALPQWYQAADCFVLPTKALEGFGLVTLEALACGTPVLGTPVGGTTEILRLLPEWPLLMRDAGVEAIADKITDAVAWVRQPDWLALRARCAEVARQFSIEALAARAEVLYHQAVAR